MKQQAPGRLSSLDLNYLLGLLYGAPGGSAGYLLHLGTEAIRKIKPGFQLTMMYVQLYSNGTILCIGDQPRKWSPLKVSYMSLLHCVSWNPGAWSNVQFFGFYVFYLFIPESVFSTLLFSFSLLYFQHKPPNWKASCSSLYFLPDQVFLYLKVSHQVCQFKSLFD